MVTASAVRAGRAKVGGMDVAYESAGTGKPALMLIHGIFQDRSYFVHQQAHFSKERQVVSLDLRGHGESSAPNEVTLEDFADDVIAVAEDAGLESAILCGHSMGGAVALKVAAARPKLVCGAVLLDSPILFPEPIRQAALMHLVTGLATEHWMDVLRGFIGKQILSAQDPPDLTARVTADLDQARQEFARTFFASLFAADHGEDLKNAPCPVLYVHAKAPADLQRLAELRPDAMVGQVVGSGHYLMLTVPDQLNAMLHRFLEIVESPGI